MRSRSPVLARNGMVATSQPLASAAALRILEEGGNAVDAAICAAAVLNVVEPMSTGIGGDMFALVYMQQDGKPVGLNGSGWAGSKIPKLDELPRTGIHSVSVPGAVAGWFKLHQRYGKTSMTRILAPAIAYAEDGFAVSGVISNHWLRSEDKLRATPGAARAFLVNGTRAPQHGEVFRIPDLARSFRRIADGGRDAFYHGEIAREIVDFSDKLGGMLTFADFADFDAQWIDPLFTTYRDHAVYELGPPTHGIAVLEMLNILEGYDLQALGQNSVEGLHLMIEAKRLAFADRDAYIADPDRTGVPAAQLLSKTYADDRRKLIRRERAMTLPEPGLPETGDTVYLSVVDKDHNAVSFINSLFEGFGSGLVVSGTGIVLHNRASLFRLDPNHPNSIAPRKRPLHTLIPGMVVKQGKPYFSFGVMGGDMQPQGHVQVLINFVDFGMDVQAAGEAARFRHSGDEIFLEPAFQPQIWDGLRRKGHRLGTGVDLWGGYQGILIDPETGTLIGGSDPRKDGLAIGW